MPAGRPSKVEWDNEKLAQVEALASIMTVEDIAEYFGIEKTTFYRNADKQPEIMQRYKMGRQKAQKQVATSLLEQCYAGNLTAMIFYLKTQHRWRETTHVDMTSSDGSMSPQGVDPKKLTDDVLKAILDAKASPATDS